MTTTPPVVPPGDAERLLAIREFVSPADTTTDRVFLLRQIDARDAEITRLNALVEQYREPPHGHKEPCLMCGEPCSSFAGNPGLWPVRLGNDGWHHIGCINRALAEIAHQRGA